MVKQGRKTNEIEKEERMVRIYEEILYGSLPDVEIKKLLAREWEITTRAVTYMIIEARKRLKEKFKDNHDEILSTQVSRYEDLLKRSRSKNNTRVEREVLKDLSDLYQLNQTKIDITSGNEKIGINIILSQDERESSN